MLQTFIDFLHQILASKYFWQWSWGVIGSLSIEVLAFKRAALKSNNFPKQYSSWVLFSTIVFSLIAGITAIMLDATSFYAAFYCGASAPVLFDRAAKGLE